MKDQYCSNCSNFNLEYIRACGEMLPVCYKRNLKDASCKNYKRKWWKFWIKEV